MMNMASSMNLSELAFDTIRLKRRPASAVRQHSRLCGEVHAPEEGLEAGVGAEGVDEGPSSQIRHYRIVFLRSLRQPRHGLVMLSQSQGGMSH